MSREEPPEDWRDRESTSDEGLLAQERELRMVTPWDKDYFHISTEIPTFIKWIQSVEEADPEWVRTNSEGQIIAVAATIPRGLVKLQSSSRKSNTPSQVVSYGPYHD